MVNKKSHAPKKGHGHPGTSKSKGHLGASKSKGHPSGSKSKGHLGASKSKGHLGASKSHHDAPKDHHHNDHNAHTGKGDTAHNKPGDHKPDEHENKVIKTPVDHKGKPQAKKVNVVKKLLIGEEAKRSFSKSLICALAPIRIFSTCFGQFPFKYKIQKDGTCLYKFTWTNLNTVYFIFMMIISYYSLIVGGCNLFLTITGAYELSKTVERVEERWHEKSLMHRHLIWVISMFSAIIQSCISYLYLYKNRHYMPSVLTFYTKVVQQLHMDISDGVFTSTLALIVVYVVSFTAIFIMGVTKFAPVAVGAPTLLGIYLLRFFLLFNGFWIEHTEKRIYVQIFGAVFLILLFAASKVQMIMFVFHCKAMKNAFACWNGRAYIALMKGGKYFLTQEGKLTYRLLYKDHTVLLDMMEATNRLCKGTMEIYYGLQTATIFFEIYFCIRAFRYGDDRNAAADGLYFIRPNDYIPGILLASQSIILAMYTASVAISVGQEAMAGLDIVRRKTMLHRKTDDEVFFQLSMQASFNSFQRFDICGGGYQYLNTDWIMGYVNNIGSYFIILYQFQPAMDRNTHKEWERRKNLGEFLSDLEGLKEGHYLGTSAPPAEIYGPPK